MTHPTRFALALTSLVALSALVACGSSASSGGSSASGTGASDPGTGGSGGGTGGSGGSGGTGGSGPTGALCNDLLHSDVASSTWDDMLVAADFVGIDSADAYSSLNTCACVHTFDDLGCMELCGASFCSGAAASTDCAGCMKMATRCLDAISLCAAN